jgi:CheY-like chemotaxis protein
VNGENLKTVLVVDDDRLVLMALERRMTREGWRVLQAPDGVSALDLVQHNRIDAVVMDVGLPGELDGLQVAFKLHDDPDTARMPIIFITGNPGTEFKEDCSFVRGRYFITKPYDADVLIQLLRGVFASDELSEVRAISAAKRRQPTVSVDALRQAS